MIQNDIAEKKEFYSKLFKGYHLKEFKNGLIRKQRIRSENIIEPKTRLRSSVITSAWFLVAEEL